MKTPTNTFRRFLTTGLLLLPAIASAHPGHYHPPGEEDEFDAIRANFLHLHGNLEIGIALLALASFAAFLILRNRPARLAAAVTFGGALAFIAVH